MRILLVHNQYQQPGGEDVVFALEAALLRERGQEVLEYVVRNEAISRISMPGTAINAIWSRRSYQEIRKMTRRVRPQLVHFHNTLPLVSPAGYYAARAEGAAVVQTLHNYRLLCPSATCFRNGKVCEDCLGKSLPWPGVVHGCYRQSRAATGVVAAMLGVHRALGTWSKAVDVYIALTRFARRKFIQGGLPADRIAVKPNFVSDSAVKRESGAVRREGALFVGRLSAEKGIGTLLQAWRDMAVHLRIVGDGPLADSIRRCDDQAVKGLGRKTRPEVTKEMRRAAFLVMPSEWYETFGLTIVEAFAQGLPVIASRLGAMAEIIEDRVTGLHFTPGDAEDLAAKVRWAAEHPDEMRRMGANARRAYEQKYTPEANYRQLMAIYQEAMAENRLKTDQTSISPA
ncbi:MAG: glycosyltransferase family 4 protein [Alphaproteobacteria bacterium]